MACRVVKRVRLSIAGIHGREDRDIYIFPLKVDLSMNHKSADRRRNSVVG